MNKPDPLILVHTTCGDEQAAERLARQLVDERLAACASLGRPVVSVYPWQGRIEREPECPLTLKTCSTVFDRLARRIGELHDYDVPEILAVEVSNANADYADWVRDWVSAGEAE